MPAEEKPTFGKYQVLELLGEGGMGRVWRGYDPDLEVPVAIKELKEQFRDPNNLERFYREAQIAAKCRHQNIVLITDLSKDPPYFVMEFLEAQELSLYIQKGRPITLERMVNVLGQVCDGLGFLHKRGIFHRDLKPANIMLLADDTVKIADFGISKAPFGQKTMTQVVMGTIPYMSPEQITSPSSVDARVDLWALGVILFEITQRKHPFPGEGDINTIFHIVHSEHAPFSPMPPQLDAPIREIIGRALRKKPEERIPTTKEFSALLRGLLRAVEDPGGIVFPWQPPTDSTMVLSAADIPAAVDPAMVERAHSLIQEIEELPPEIRAVVEGATYERAAERARLSKQVLKEGDPKAIESAIRSLESQKAAINEAIQAGFDHLVAQAETALAKGRESEAASLYRQVQEGDPSRAEAVDGFERAIQAMLARGRRSQTQGNLTAAVEAWKEVLSFEPRHAEAARLIQEAEGEKAAREAMERGLAAARAALQARRPEDARAALKAVFDRDPGHAEGREIESQSLRMIEEATRTLHADALRKEGRHFLERQDFERARLSFTTLLEMLPGDEEAGKALQAIDSALEVRRRRDAARAVVADAERAMQEADFRRAVDLFGRALAELPGDQDVGRRLQTAQRRLDALLNAESEAGQREKSGDPRGAAQIWEQVLKLQPGHPSATKEIARLTALAKAAEERRKKEEDSRRQAVERLWQEHSAPVASFRAVPAADHKALGAELVGRASEALAQMEKARAGLDAESLNDGAAALSKAMGKLEARRGEILRAKASEIEEAARAIEEILGPSAAGVKEAAVRGAKEAVARARKDSAGPAIHPLEGHVAGLKKIREGLQREMQSALHEAREKVREAKDILGAAAVKNRRAVDRRPDLRKRIDELGRQAGTAATSTSIEALRKLAISLAQARAEVPTDPLRFLPHMIAAAAVVAAAGSFIAWRLIQAGTAHPYVLEISPWGRVVSVESPGGETAAAPAGEGPSHRLELLPGSWTITVENSGTGARSTLTATIPDDTGGSISIQGPDVREGIRALVAADPWLTGEGAAEE